MADETELEKIAGVFKAAALSVDDSAQKLNDGSLGDSIQRRMQSQITAAKDDKGKIKVFQAFTSALNALAAKLGAIVPLYEPKKTDIETAAAGIIDLMSAGKGEDANKAYDAAMTTFAAEKDALLYTLHKEIDAESALKGKKIEKLNKVLSRMIDEDRLQKYAGISADGKVLNGPGMMTRVGVGAAGAIIAGAAIKSAMGDKGVNEQGEPKKMGFMGKVVVTLGAVGGLFLLASAFRGGSITQGIKEGQGVVGKFTGMLSSGLKLGAYKGI